MNSDKTIRDLRRILFGIASPQAAEAAAEYGRQQAVKYSHAGLRYIPAAEMPDAVDRLFDSLAFAPGRRLLEIGPGPHGGLGLIAARMGSRVTMVETDKPFTIDVDSLKQQLAASGASGALTELASLTGTIEVKPVDNLKRLLKPHLDAIRAARGSIEIVAGDFADVRTRQQAAVWAPFDHVVCTDVVSPLGDTLNTTTAATTTGERGRVMAVVDGLVRLSRRAQSLYVGVVIPEENDECRAGTQAIYDALERGLGGHGLKVEYERVICPSSSTVVRARLYRLAPAA